MTFLTDELISSTDAAAAAHRLSTSATPFTAVFDFLIEFLCATQWKGITFVSELSLLSSTSVAVFTSFQLLIFHIFHIFTSVF